MGKVDHVHFRRFGPARNRDFAVARVDADGDLTRKAPRRVAHEIRIAHRRRADDDTRHAFAKPAFDRPQIADATAELHRHFDARENGIHSTRIHRLAGESTVEIDDMQIGKALTLESLGLRRGIFVKYCRLIHVAIEQTDAFAVLKIDCGKQDHGCHRRKLAIKARPSF